MGTPYSFSAFPREPPKYPVINEAPTLGAVIANFGAEDVGRIFGTAALGAVWGFVWGSPIRRHNLLFVAGVGGMIASFASFKYSTMRLTGFYSNPRECVRAGMPAEAGMPA